MFLLSMVHLIAKDAPAPVFEIRFENHCFTPRSLVVPAGRQVRIKVVNASPERIEFESFKLNREKVIEAGKEVTVDLPPLKAGNYDFYDDFHADVPEGEIVAR
ncbi:MAG TPA: cupredoxin domain-containing protein [Opitutaceae bacterium]|nr:cupredoxin domain-containing protein [Opitutaceae bacterium]